MSSNEHDARAHAMDRRTFIRAGAAATVTALSGVEVGCAAEPTLCTVTPTFQEGPFYVNTLTAGLKRRDVTEGMRGAPMLVRMTLLESQTCRPCANLPVDIWSTSPMGLYSAVDNSIVLRGGEDTTGTTYMRGHQFTDGDGVVEFETLFPGWYEVTPPHLHFTTQLPGERAYTWQFFIDDAFAEEVYTTVEPYAARGVHPVRTDSRTGYVRDALTVTPTGTATSPIIDVVVGIDMEALLERADEYDS